MRPLRSATKQVATGLLVGLVLAWTGAAVAQELSAHVTDRCVRAAVRIVALDARGEPLSTGSGTVIDPRGYVLTNFHVVGHVTVESGTPGTLFDPRNRYQVSLVASARESAQPRYLAEVVRGDALLDLALLRIVSDAQGQPIARGTRFGTVPLADTSALRPGTRVWAFGFPMGVRTINVTGGQVTGFQMNAREQVAWLRSDAEFNPGNSGGMLVDASGRLVAVPTAVVHGQRTLEPIELARPVERVPAEWLRSLRRGELGATVITGVPALREGDVLRDAALGDVAGLGAPEMRFYVIGPELRPSRIRASVATLSLALAGPRGRLVRRGQGSIDVLPGDPPELVLAVIVENPAESPVEFELRVERGAATPAVAGRATPGYTQQLLTQPGQGTPPSVVLPPAPGAPPVLPPAPGAGPLPPATRGLPSAATPGVGGQPLPGAPPMMGIGRATVRGTVVDAGTGRPVADVMILVGRPGLDLARHIALFLERRLTEAQFYAELAGYGRTDGAGRYEVSGLVSNTSYPAASMARGFRPAMLRIGVGTEGSVLELNTIAISR